jgi:PAS domain-containing protein
MEERLAVATLAADIGIWDLDVPSDSLLWYYRCAEIFGAPLESGRWKESVSERVHAEDRNRVESAMEAALHPAEQAFSTQNIELCGQTGRSVGLLPTVRPSSNTSKESARLSAF